MHIHVYIRIYYVYVHIHIHIHTHMHAQVRDLLAKYKCSPLTPNNARNLPLHSAVSGGGGAVEGPARAAEVVETLLSHETASFQVFTARLECMR